MLAAATEAKPHGVINVGIFGEGTDSPSLSAVAFLEPRKSPIDVIQAVGRAMRTAEGKPMGYVICPIVFPPYADAETWLSNSAPEEGWKELGDILLALRAHDDRIENNLAELLHLYLPKVPERTSTFVALGNPESGRIRYYVHQGAPGQAQEDVEAVLQGASPRASRFTTLPASAEVLPTLRDSAEAGVADAISRTGESATSILVEPPTVIVTGKLTQDGSLELRSDTVARANSDANGAPGVIDVRKTKAKARNMINKGEGNPLPTSAEREARRARGETRAFERQLRLLAEMKEFGDAIRMNLLEKSGLASDRIMRDLNILRECVDEAAFHLNADELRPKLDSHFQLDNLKDSGKGRSADGCTIAALLMMNAAMLHQRIAKGRWLPGVSDLETVKNEVNVVTRVEREWNRIRSHDFQPVLEPAVEAIHAIQDTGKLAGLERALRHIAAEAERIAETYADMGADHAGPLFNRVMGNQASDGAFFTRPVAASIAARLTLDACGDVDWSDPEIWREHKTVDLACGSGTLLAAILTEMKRRAAERGTGRERLVELQRLAVEETIKGMDINPVSLQLAASQLTAGNHEIRYRRMGLHQMPYGPSKDDPGRVSVGTLELLGQRAIVARRGELNIADDKIASQSVWPERDDVELEDAVAAAQDARIIIMNPPFTERVRMGEKFPKDIQGLLRKRTDALEDLLVRADPALADFVSRRAVAPLFVTLADKAMAQEAGILAMITPTIMFSNTSAQQERRILAQRFHIHTILTCHQPGNLNMSQNTNINESIVVMRRHAGGPKPPTRFIQLDRLPSMEEEVANLHAALLACSERTLANGWGEVSHWPADRMEASDWTPAIWRSPELAQAAAWYASAQSNLTPFSTLPGVSVNLTSPDLILHFQNVGASTPGSFPVLKSRGAEGQLRIESVPDEYRVPKGGDESRRRANGGTYPESDKILAKAGYLLVTDGQRTNTARLTSIAGDDKHVGVG